MPVTEVDGLAISYDDRGTGEPALLCLTGWCSSKARYDHLVPLLAEKRRTLAFDWRGHGDSQRDVEDFGQEEMVADALGVIEASGVEQVVPVAASHSGWVAIELRRRLGPERVPKIVHMDWMVIEPSERYMATLHAMRTPEGWPEARETLFTIWRAGSEAPAIEAVIDVMREQGGEMWMRSGREITAAYERNSSPLQTYERMDPPPSRRPAPLRAAAGSRVFRGTAGVCRRSPVVQCAAGPGADSFRDGRDGEGGLSRDRGVRRRRLAPPDAPGPGCPRQESNLRARSRKPLNPLSFGGFLAQPYRQQCGTSSLPAQPG